MSIGRRLRFEVLRRDGFACRYCGAKAPDVVLEVDHVIPTALGGADDPTNLVTSCASCNAGKASTAPESAVVADVDAASLLFARAMEQASDVRRREIADADAVTAAFDAAWRFDSGSALDRPGDWPDTVQRFLGLGLTMDDLRRFIDVAMRSRAKNGDVWRYFCGCCWNEVADRQELARRLIEDGQV